MDERVASPVIFESPPPGTRNLDKSAATASSRTLSVRVARLWWIALIEWLVILLIAFLYSGQTLLDFDPFSLQQTGEQPESATLPLLAEVSIGRYHEVPLWNPYMLTGFPLAGDLVSHFWNPVSTIPVLIWGGINGMKVSIFLSFFLAGIGQWLFAQIFGIRGPLRVWAAVTFMISGGLALYWRVGWYELLLGAVWFPWCFASLWWALHRRDRRTVVLCAISIGLVLTSGGGYYPLYLLGSLTVLVLSTLFFSRSQLRWLRLRRAVAIAILSAGLAAVVLVPWIDGYRYTRREAGPDPEQKTSQPIPYALVNYFVSEPEWYRTEILGSGSGVTWFYIGILPLVGVALAPLAFRGTKQRALISTVAVLTLFLLVWHANKYTPIHYLYELIPFLYTFRFPMRLLVIATSPLLVLGAYGLQHAYYLLRRWGRSLNIAVSVNSVGKRAGFRQPLLGLISALFAIYLFVSVRDVYEINRGFAFDRGRLEPRSLTALNWLKNYDKSLYYTNIGGGFIYWPWTPAAYMLEMAIINFQYNRFVATQVAQHSPSSPFFAMPKYMFAQANQPRPSNAKIVNQFGDFGLWYLPDSLPFAFAAEPGVLQSGKQVTKSEVTPLTARLDGPNRVVVSGSSDHPSRLAVLVSDYPGWTLRVDGNPRAVVPSNDYLGAAMLTGQHTYVFEFRPIQYFIGLFMSLLTVVVMIGLVLVESPLWHRRARALRPLHQLTQ